MKLLFKTKNGDFFSFTRYFFPWENNKTQKKSMKVLLVNDETVPAEKTLLNSGEVILFSRASLSIPLDGSGGSLGLLDVAVQTHPSKSHQPRLSTN